MMIRPKMHALIAAAMLRAESKMNISFSGAMPKAEYTQ